MLARRDTWIEASRVRRFSPLQSLEDQSQAWGRCCHFCTGREGLAPSWNTELQSLALCGLSEDSVLFRPTGHTGRKVTQHGQRTRPTIIASPPMPAPPRPPAASTSSRWHVRCCGGREHAPYAPWLRRYTPRGRPAASCPARARPAPPPPPPGPRGLRRALGGHTAADTRGHTPHERTPRWRVMPPSVLAHAQETGPAPGSTVPHGRGVPRAPSHTPAAPEWCQTGRYSTAAPQRGVRWLYTGKAEYSDKW